MNGDELDRLVRAMSHATRRQILRLCANGPVSAGDVAAQIDLALASVSEHLKVLRKNELVDVERGGTRWFYTTNIERINQVITALDNDLPTGASKEKP